MGEKFVEWFYDLTCQVAEFIRDALYTAIVFLLSIVTLPIWIFPFIYWYFFKYKRNVANKNALTNADRIRSMSIDKLAEFLKDVKNDYQWANPDYPSEDDFSAWVDWLQSEVEG